MTIRLSICIPTYNRAQFIAATLESILSQAQTEVEIVIMDGASTDHTESVVQEFQERFNNIRYYRGQKNMGVDADLAKAINFAQGEYCWLMSSDDLLTCKAVSVVLSEIESGCGIYLCNRTECTKEMIPIIEQHWFPQKFNDRIFDFSDGEDLREYLGATNMIGALFSYIPSVIVSRQLWLSIEGSEEFFGTGYAHVYTLFSIIKKKCKLKYVSSSLVLCRMDNDSFSSNGLVSRYLLDFQGYLRIANKLFSGDRMREVFLKVMTREHRWFRLLKLRAHVEGGKKWEEIRNLLLEFGYSPLVIDLCGFFGNFRRLVFALVSTRKILARL